jgi:hypothetical protein
VWRFKLISLILLQLWLKKKINLKNNGISDEQGWKSQWGCEVTRHCICANWHIMEHMSRKPQFGIPCRFNLVWSRPYSTINSRAQIDSILFRNCLFLIISFHIFERPWYDFVFNNVFIFTI